MSSDAKTMVKTVETEHLGDVWLGWVERHYGLARSEMVQVASGWQVTAHLPEQANKPARGGESLDGLAAAASSSGAEDLERADLVELLGRLREAREQFDALEDRVLVLASQRRASLRELSAALGGGSPEGVRKRLSRLGRH